MGDLDIDTILDLLADEERREILTKLQDAETLDMSPDKEMHIRLCHVHLPKLAAQNIITFEYTSTSIEIERGDEYTTIEPLLNKVRASQPLSKTAP